MKTELGATVTPFIITRQSGRHVSQKPRVKFAFFKKYCFSLQFLKAFLYLQRKDLLSVTQPIDQRKMIAHH